MGRSKHKPSTLTVDMVDDLDLIYLSVFWSAPEFRIMWEKLGIIFTLEDYYLYRSRYSELAGDVRGVFDKTRYIKYIPKRL